MLSDIKLEILGYLKGKSLQGKWVSQKELYFDLQSLGYGLSMRQMRKEINELRKDMNIEYIIISNTTFGYKILSCEEEVKYLEAKKIQALRKLKLYWKDVERLSRNNQMVMEMLNNEEHEHIKSILKGEVDK